MTIPYAWRLDYRARILWLRLRLFVLCRHLDLHSWKLFTGWTDCGIPDRVACKRCGVWKDQGDE